MSDINPLIESLDQDRALEFFEAAPNATNIVTKPEEKKEPQDNFHNSLEPDFNFSDYLPKKDKEDIAKEVAEKKDLLGTIDNKPQEVAPTEKEVVNAVTFVSKLIEKDKLLGFEDDQPLSTLKDVEEIIEANIKEAERKGKEDGLKSLIDSLPQDVQMVLDYALRGGRETKNLFKALSTVEEVRELSIDSEDGQEQAARRYLSLTSFGTPEEIDEQINEWKDLGNLDKKAKLFKPKLDKLETDKASRLLEDQAQREKEQQEASKQYTANVYEAIKDGTLGGIKIDKKTQALLFNGLVRGEYESITGQNTNLLGHLLEKYQFVEPNYPLILEATWLLSDPEAYRNKVRTELKQEVDAENYRKIKSIQGNRNSGTGIQDTSDNEKPKIKRTGFFSNTFK